MKKKIGIIAALAAVLLILGAAGFRYRNHVREQKETETAAKTEISQEEAEEEVKEAAKKEEEPKQDTGDSQEGSEDTVVNGEAENPEDGSEEEESGDSQSSTGESVDVLKEIQDTQEASDQEGMNDLKEQLELMVSGYEGDWSVYVYDLKKKVYLNINSHSVKAASLIKLYVMGAVLEKTESGEMTADASLEGLLRDMITVSDNEATNELVRRLGGGNDPVNGMKAVNAFARKYGYEDTSQGRELRDVRDTQVSGENFTSAKDSALFMKSVYDGTCVSKEASDKMLELLKGQTRTWKIPAGVPAGTVTANKTGELSDTENDTAIVYSPGTDYVLTVTSTAVPDVKTAQSRIVEISSVVYQYFNP